MADNRTERLNTQFLRNKSYQRNRIPSNDTVTIQVVKQQLQAIQFWFNWTFDTIKLTAIQSKQKQNILKYSEMIRNPHPEISYHYFSQRENWQQAHSHGFNLFTFSTVTESNQGKRGFSKEFTAGNFIFCSASLGFLMVTSNNFQYLPDILPTNYTSGNIRMLTENNLRQFQKLGWRVSESPVT